MRKYSTSCNTLGKVYDIFSYIYNEQNKASRKMVEITSGTQLSFGHIIQSTQLVYCPAKLILVAKREGFLKSITKFSYCNHTL